MSPLHNSSPVSGRYPVSNDDAIGTSGSVLLSSASCLTQYSLLQSMRMLSRSYKMFIMYKAVSNLYDSPGPKNEVKRHVEPHLLVLYFVYVK